MFGSPDAVTTVPNQPSAIAAPAPGQATSRLWLFTPVGAIQAGVLLLALIGLFFRWLETQHLLSKGAMEDWGHAYFIPLICGYLIYRRQAELARVRYATFWPGLAPLLLGVMAYFFCVVGIKNHMLQGFSIVLTVMGLVLLLLGPRALMVLFLPIAFLGFGVTISDIIMTRVTFPLQLIATQGAYVVLTLVGAVAGFGVDAQGNILTVTTSRGQSIPLNVAEACSGLRMVVAFCALGGIVAILACRQWWQRILVVLLAPPVAIVVNVFRVAVLGLLSLRDANLATGEAHTLVGTILLIPGLGLFLAVVWALNKIDASEEPAK